MFRVHRHVAPTEKQMLAKLLRRGSHKTRWNRQLLFFFLILGALLIREASNSLPWLRDAKSRIVEMSFHSERMNRWSNSPSSSFDSKRQNKGDDKLSKSNIPSGAEIQSEDGDLSNHPPSPKVKQDLNADKNSIPGRNRAGEDGSFGHYVHKEDKNRTDQTSLAHFRSRCLVGSIADGQQSWSSHLVPDASLLRLRGFRRCHYLNNAVFDARIWLYHPHSASILDFVANNGAESSTPKSDEKDGEDRKTEAGNINDEEVYGVEFERAKNIQTVLQNNARLLEKEINFPRFRSRQSTEKKSRWPSHVAREVDPCEIVALVEFQAGAVARRVKLQAQALHMRELNNTEDLMRFSCYEASLGNNMFVGNGLVNRERYDRGIDENPSMLHLRPFLMHVHGPTYFPFLDGMLEDFDDMARQSASSSWCKYEHGPNPQNGIELVSRHSVAGKPHYQLAYLILGYQSAANVQILLDRLWHPTDVIIGIHIDLDSREKKVEVEKHVQRYYPGATNIIFIDPVRVIWGNISIVFAQLRGFFQLLKVATWDHIINLSENDYPLVTNRRIHTNIRKNVNYIMWHQEKLRGAQTSRLRTVCLKYSENGAKCRYATPAGAAPEVKLYLRRQFPCGEWNTELKNSQWMILSQAFVESIRISPAAANLLAFVEHTFIPDESYFALIAAHSPWGGVYLDEDDSVSDNAEPRQQRYRNDRHNLGLEDERTEAKRAQLQSFWTEKRNHRFLKMKGPHPEKLTMRTFSTVAKKLCGPSAVLRPDEKNAKTLYCKGLEGEMLGETYFFARKITLSQEVDGLVKYIDENFNLGPLGRNIFSATRIRNSTRKFSRLNSNFRIP